MRYSIACFLSLFAFAYAAHGASVIPVRGDVFVDLGAGFEPLTTELTVLPGTRMMVAPNGLAHIDYGGGCRQSVVAGTIPIVAASPPCPNGLFEGFGEQLNASLPTPPTIPGDTDALAGAPSTAQGIPIATIVIGGVVIVGGVGLAIGLSGGGDSSDDARNQAISLGLSADQSTLPASP
ncbi:MAG: hypothetical protein AAFO75_03845 [Pseudomonadota bacterium]